MISEALSLAINPSDTWFFAASEELSPSDRSSLTILSDRPSPGRALLLAGPDDRMEAEVVIMSVLGFLFPDLNLSPEVFGDSSS